MKDFFRRNGILLLVIAGLLAAITLVSSALFGGVANPLAGVVGVITTPFRDGLNAAVNWMEDRADYAFSYDRLTEENAALKKRVAEMEEQVRSAQTAIDENERFRNLIGLARRRKDFVFETATITAQGASNWESTLTIGKGSNAGIAAKNCVVDEYGNLVGVVATVGSNWATVATLVDTDTDMGGLLARSDAAAILQGDFALMGEKQLKLTYLPDGSEVNTGDEVLTSGLGGVYPAGLVVGTVAEVRSDPSGMGRYAVVTPGTDLESLRQVFVIKSFNIVD